MNDIITLADRYFSERSDLGRMDVHGRNTLLFHLRELTRWLAESMGITTADQWSVETLPAWVRHLNGKRTRTNGLPLQPQTVYAYLTETRMFCEWLIRGGYLPPEILAVFPQMQRPPARLQIAMRHAEVRQWLDTLPLNTLEDFRFRTIAEVLYTSGMRATESVQLDLGDVDFSAGQARVMGKGQKERMVPLGRTAIHHLEVYLAAIRPLFLRGESERALWLNRRGVRHNYCALHRAFEKLPPDATGCRVMPHVLRRSCATELLRSGANAWAVKELLGHDDLETLEHYALLDLEDLRLMHARCHPRDLPAGTKPDVSGDMKPGSARTDPRWSHGRPHRTRRRKL